MFSELNCASLLLLIKITVFFTSLSYDGMSADSHKNYAFWMEICRTSKNISGMDDSLPYSLTPQSESPLGIKDDGEPLFYSSLCPQPFERGTENCAGFNPVTSHYSIEPPCYPFLGTENCAAFSTRLSFDLIANESNGIPKSHAPKSLAATSSLYTLFSLCVV